MVVLQRLSHPSFSEISHREPSSAHDLVTPRGNLITFLETLPAMVIARMLHHLLFDPICHSDEKQATPGQSYIL